MNISTYEARIAALEAQLGPGPGPSGGSGILSVVVNPDINLNDGRTLNAALNELMPVTESGDRMDLLTASLTVGNVYRINVTPAKGWYAYPFVGSMPSAATGEAGEPVEYQFAVTGDGRENTLQVYAAVGQTVELDMDNMVTLRANVVSPLQ